jgi:hypothetical protein
MCLEIKGKKGVVVLLFASVLSSAGLHDGHGNACNEWRQHECD